MPRLEADTELPLDDTTADLLAEAYGQEVVGQINAFNHHRKLRAAEQGLDAQNPDPEQVQRIAELKATKDGFERVVHDRRRLREQRIAGLISAHGLEAHEHGGWRHNIAEGTIILLAAPPEEGKGG